VQTSFHIYSESFFTYKFIFSYYADDIHMSKTGIWMCAEL